jgi:hypothetical protein
MHFILANGGQKSHPAKIDTQQGNLCTPDQGSRIQHGAVATHTQKTIYGFVKCVIVVEGFIFQTI